LRCKKCLRPSCRNSVKPNYSTESLRSSCRNSAKPNYGDINWRHCVCNSVKPNCCKESCQPTRLESSVRRTVYAHCEKRFRVTGLDLQSCAAGTAQNVNYVRLPPGYGIMSQRSAERMHLWLTAIQCRFTSRRESRMATLAPYQPRTKGELHT
jgi:hypothetical protein